VIPLDETKIRLVTEFLQQSFVGCSVDNWEDEEEDSLGCLRLPCVLRPSRGGRDRAGSAGPRRARVSQNSRKPICHCEESDDRDRGARAIVTPVDELTAEPAERAGILWGAAVDRPWIGRIFG
jgi:hypothetical protein